MLYNLNYAQIIQICSTILLHIITYCNKFFDPDQAMKDPTICSILFVSLFFSIQHDIHLGTIFFNVWQTQKT